jgi:rubrerythrin
MGQLALEIAKKLFEHHRNRRTGVSEIPEMASVCLICGSNHIDPVNGDSKRLVCRNCGFAFYRYECPTCGKTIDGRDPQHLKCRTCREPQCTCGACGCPPSHPQ